MGYNIFKTKKILFKVICSTVIYSLVFVSAAFALQADIFLPDSCQSLDTLAPHITLTIDSLRNGFVQPTIINQPINAELEIVVREIKISNVKITPLERLDEEIENAEAIFSTLTQDQLLEGLRQLPGQESLQWSDLSKKVFISFFEEGAAKLVFKVEFEKNNGELIALALILKGAKYAQDIAPEETRDLKRLTKAGNKHIPVFIHEFEKDTQGRIWFLEEFIPGLTVEQYRKTAVLDAGIVKNIIAVLLSIGKDLTNQIPFDFHGGNFIIKEGVSESDNPIVMVDIGKDRRAIVGEADKRNPHAQMQNRVLFLALLVARYGFYEQGTSTDANDFIFDAILNDRLLNADDKKAGREVIETAYQYLINNDRAQIAKMIFQKGKHPFRGWGVNRKNMQPMIDFVSVFESHLRHYLMQKEIISLQNNEVLTTRQDVQRDPLAEQLAIDLVGQAI